MNTKLLKEFLASVPVMRTAIDRDKIKRGIKEGKVKAFIAFKGVDFERRSPVVMDWIIYKKDHEVVDKKNVTLNPNIPCGRGLHVTTKSNAPNWGGLVIKVLIPAKNNTIVFPTKGDKLRVKRLYVLS